MKTIKSCFDCFLYKLLYSQILPSTQLFPSHCLFKIYKPSDVGGFRKLLKGKEQIKVKTTKHSKMDKASYISNMHIYAYTGICDKIIELCR